MRLESRSETKMPTWIAISEDKKTISGKLTRLNSNPLYAHKVSIVAKDILGQNITLGTAKTNNLGEYSIKSEKEFDLSKGLYLVVSDLFAKHGFINPSEIIYDTIRLPEQLAHKVTESRKVEALEYADKTTHPLQPKNSDHIRCDRRWFVGLVAQNGYDEILKNLTGKALNFFGLSPSLETIEKWFDKSDKELKHDSKTLVDMMFNGIYAPPAFVKDEKNPDVLIAPIHWGRYKMENSKDALPDMDVVLKKVYDENKVHIGYEIIEIRVKKDHNDTKPLIFKNSKDPNKSKLFVRVLKLLACELFVRGQAESHLGMTHLEGGEYEMASERCFKESAIHKLVETSTRGLKINDDGSKLIFDKEQGALGISALSQEGIDDILIDVLSYRDYNVKPAAERFQPSKENPQGDIFAKEKQLFYSKIRQVIEKFLENHRKNIEEHWHEVFYFSKDLVEHSLPYRPWQGQNLKNLDDISEVDDPNAPEREKGEDGIVRTIRPITKNIKGPDKGDWERLTRALTHMCFINSYLHNKLHESLKKYKLSFANLRPREVIEKDPPFMGIKTKEAIDEGTVGAILIDADAAITGKSFLDEPDLAQEWKDVFQTKETIKEFEALGVKLETVPTSRYI